VKSVALATTGHRQPLSPFAARAAMCPPDGQGPHFRGNFSDSQDFCEECETSSLNKVAAMVPSIPQNEVITMFHIILTKSSKAPAMLSLNQLIVFSKLAFATHAVSTPILARWTRLSEREVDLCLAELSAMGLVYSDCGGAGALEPPPGWFIPRRNFTKPTWPYRIAYWTLFPSTNGKLTTEESATWSYVFTSNNITEVVSDSYIASATGIPEPKVAKAVAALIHEGLVREIGRLRTAFYEARFGQVLDKGATMNANKRSCFGNAKNGATQKPKGPVEDFEELLDREMKEGGDKTNRDGAVPPELRNAGDFVIDLLP
jgi:hypothetical protein